jgi:aquaporin Z
MDRPLGQRLLAEFIGPFALVFVGAGAVIAAGASGNGAGGAGVITIAAAYGLAFAAMVTALGHISGGHINPAVTIGAWVTQKISSRDALSYVVAQCAGGVVGGFLLRASMPQTIWRPVHLGTPLVAGVTNGQAVLIEAVLTFFLVWVIFASAIDPEGAFGKVAGLAIGFVVFVDVAMAYPFTGAAIDPARALGPELAGGTWTGWWVYWVGPVAGAVIAAALYDWAILQRRGAGGAATEAGEAPHGWGAHGGDADATPGAPEGDAFGGPTP